MGPYTTPEIIKEFSRDERCLFMTDAWVEDEGVQNPAIYDCFPKFLRDALLGYGDVLPKAIRRMTGATADRFQLQDRGYLKPGCFADITVFDEEALKAATPDQTCSFGIAKVFINGRLVLDGSDLQPDALRTAGRAIEVL
jgi:N-acyl-D-amino-acid deacylase